MSRYVLFAILGLGAGTLYAALAQALLVGYRGSGVFNMAQGSMAMYVSYVFYGLRTSGHLLLPPLPNPLAPVEGIDHWGGGHLRLPHFPAFVSLGAPMSFWPAAAIALAASALLGLLLHYAVFRPLRAAPNLAKFVASIGIMLVLQAIGTLRFGTTTATIPAMLPSNTVHILGQQVPINRFVLLGIAAVLTAGLAALYRFSRFGLATQAASANERGAIVSGLNTDHLAGANWVLASVVGGIIGILFGSITGLDPTSYTLFILPALGAALVAGFTSFTTAAVAGVGIGVLQSLALPLQTTYHWFPQFGAADGIPFIVIIVAMIIRGKSLPVRGAIAEQRLPASPEPKGRAVPLTVAALAVLGLFTLHQSLRSGLINSLAGVLLALSLVVLVGMAGQISLMQVAIAGLSGLAMTRLAGDWGIPFPVAPLLAAIFAAAVGVVTGLPALRIRGVHLAVATLGAALVVQSMILGNSSILRISDQTGSIPAPRLFGVHFGINDRFPLGHLGVPSPSFGLFVLVVAVAACWAVANLRRNSTGRQLLAIRSNERAAAALGVNVASTKLIAFSIAAFLAGLAGALSAYQFQGVGADSYTALASVTLLAVVYLGGITSISGAVLAGILVAGGLSQGVLEQFFHAGQFEDLVTSVGLILAILMNPEGVSGVLRAQGRWLKERTLWRRRVDDPVTGLITSIRLPMEKVDV